MKDNEENDNENDNEEMMKIMNEILK